MVMSLKYRSPCPREGKKSKEKDVLKKNLLKPKKLKKIKAVKGKVKAVKGYD